MNKYEQNCVIITARPAPNEPERTIMDFNGKIFSAKTTGGHIEQILIARHWMEPVVGYDWRWMELTRTEVESMSFFEDDCKEIILPSRSFYQQIEERYGTTIADALSRFFAEELEVADERERKASDAYMAKHPQAFRAD